VLFAAPRRNRLFPQRHDPKNAFKFRKVRDREAPSPAREARALPRAFA
jgi:hypothetical protein